jgi:hypothetical protein
MHSMYSMYDMKHAHTTVGVYIVVSVHAQERRIMMCWYTFQSSYLLMMQVALCYADVTLKYTAYRLGFCDSALFIQSVNGC